MLEPWLTMANTVLGVWAYLLLDRTIRDFPYNKTRRVKLFSGVFASTYKGAR